MAESKRIELTNLTTDAPAHSQKHSKNKKQTIRISLALAESTEDTCPEVNYRNEFLERAKNIIKESKDNIFEEEEDADVRRIAQQMEEKYGKCIPGNRKKRKKGEYTDIGMGYDETDSFIDNTDGYDEIIPQNVTTLYGGFYINCGALEFKSDDENLSSDDSSNDIPTVNKRKRILDLASEDSEEEFVEKKPRPIGAPFKKMKVQSPNSIQAMKKKLLGSKMQIKKKTNFQKKTVKEILREKRKDLNMSDVKEDHPDEGVNNKIDEKKISSIAETIESVVKAVSNTAANGTDDAIFKQPKMIEIPAPKTEEPKPQTEKSMNLPQNLPQNLPNDVLELISNFKTLVESAHAKGASVFAADDKNLNDILYSLEKKCKCLGKPSKHKVYEYLASLLNCKKETLISHCRNLILHRENENLKQLIFRLSCEIERIMPRAISRYEEECQQVALQKKLNPDDPKSSKIPRRRFPWSETGRKTLQDIIKVRRKCFLLEDAPRDNLESLMTTYLKTNIQILWPDGWMSSQALIKMYHQASGEKNPAKVSHAETAKENDKIKHLVNSKPEEINHRPMETASNEIVKKESEEKTSSLSNCSVVCIDENEKAENASVSQNKTSPILEVNNHQRERTNELTMGEALERLASQAHSPDILSENKVKPPNKTEHSNLDTVKKRNCFEGDHMQKVMEHLKVLQKMSAPYKSDSCSSSQVSVITSSKTLSPKPTYDLDGNDSQQQKDCIVSFQEEFQKQFLDSRGPEPLNSKLYHFN